MLRKGSVHLFSVVVVTLVLCIYFAFADAVQAQEGGVFSSGGASANEGPFEFEFDGGLKFVFDGLFLNPNTHREFIVQLTAISQEDTTIRLSRENCIAFDNMGHRFPINTPPWHVWIANENIEERMVIGDVPTKIMFVFNKGDVKFADSFARIDLNIMGKVVTMRNVPTSTE